MRTRITYSCNKHALRGLALCMCAAFLASCSPSKGFLLKRSLRLGIDKQQVRVRIVSTGERVTIASSARMRITDLKTGKAQYDGRGRRINFYPEKLSSPVIVESWEKPLSVNGRAYRGAMEIHNVLGKLYVINLLSMDEYLCGVVPSEIMSTWRAEALKAQAVAARSYAYHHMLNRKDALFDLDATASFQVYGGIAAEKESTSLAVRATSGEIAVFENRPILAYFHSTCGGSTSDDEFVWNGSRMEYLRGVGCEFCKASPYYSWEEKITLYEVRTYLAKKYRGVGAIGGITFKRNEGRVSRVTIVHKNGLLNLTGNEFRMLFPEKKLKSLYFEATKTSDGLILHGHGWGHGVGMCQWGAQGMAEKGARYKDILKHYYRGVRIMHAGGSYAHN